MAIILKKDTFLQEKKADTYREIHKTRQEKNKLMNKQKAGRGALGVLLSKWKRFVILFVLVYLAKDVSEDVFYLSLFVLAVTTVITIGYTKRPYEAKAKQATDKIFKLANEFEPWRKGLEGETIVSQELSRLPNNYYVIHDVTLHYKRRVQIDHVVVGPTGIFAIETKSMGGNLRPHLNGWLQGAKVIRSPQHQAMQGALILSSLITQRAQAVVALSNPRARWRGEQDKECPVLYSSQLVQYILNQPRTITDQYEIAQKILQNITKYN